MFLFCLLKFYINLHGHFTHSRVWNLMFTIVLWKTIVVVLGPRRISKEFSQTRFAFFIMSLKIKFFTIADDDWVPKLFDPLFVSKDQFYVGLWCLLEEAKIMEWRF